MTSRDPTLYTWWLVSRAAGVTAYAMASASVLVGLSMSAKLSRRPGGTRRLRTLHEHLAIATMAALVVHGLALLGDKWLHPGIGAILVPMRMPYRPLATAAGIIGAYGMGVLGLSFYVRRRLPVRLWRKAHRFTIVFWALAAGHALTAGTDAATPWMRLILGGSTASIAVLLITRVAEARARRSTSGSSTPRRDSGIGAPAGAASQRPKRVAA